MRYRHMKNVYVRTIKFLLQVQCLVSNTHDKQYECITTQKRLKWNMTKEGKIVLLKCTAVSIRIFSACILLTLFSYWSISAFLKYLDEPIATRTEFRFGDDNLGNISMPVISFCKSPFHRYSNDQCKARNWYETMKCIKKLGNAAKFVESITYTRPYRGKTLNKFNMWQIFY